MSRKVQLIIEKDISGCVYTATIHTTTITTTTINIITAATTTTTTTAAAVTTTTTTTTTTVTKLSKIKLKTYQIRLN